MFGIFLKRSLIFGQCILQNVVGKKVFIPYWKYELKETCRKL